MTRLENRELLLLAELEEVRLRTNLARVKLLPLEAQQLQLLQIRAQLRAPLREVTLPPPPEPPSPAQAQQLWQLADPREEQPMPAAEEQLGSLLAGPLTPSRSTPPSAS